MTSFAGSARQSRRGLTTQLVRVCGCVFRAIAEEGSWEGILGKPKF